MPLLKVKTLSFLTKTGGGEESRSTFMAFKRTIEGLGYKILWRRT